VEVQYQAQVLCLRSDLVIKQYSVVYLYSFCSINLVLKCKNLDWDVLELLLVRVDKENLMEFPLNFLYYLYNYYMVCALSSYGSYVT